MIFGISETGILESNRIWDIWALKKKHFTGALENTFLRKVDIYLKLPYQKFFWKGVVIFDHSKTSILENNRIWDIWALTEKALHWGSWKYLNTKDRQIRQISIAKQIIEKILFSNCDLWSLQTQHSWKQQNLSYLSHKEISLSLVQLDIPFYVR